MVPEAVARYFAQDLVVLIKPGFQDRFQLSPKSKRSYNTVKTTKSSYFLSIDIYRLKETATNFLIHQVENVRIKNRIINYTDTSNLLRKFRFVRKLDITALDPQQIDVARVIRRAEGCQRSIQLIADTNLYHCMKAELEQNRRPRKVSVIE